MEYLSKLTKISGWGSPALKPEPKNVVQGIARRRTSDNPEYALKLVQGASAWNFKVFAKYSWGMESFATSEDGERISLDAEGEVKVSSVDNASNKMVWKLEINKKYYSTNITPTEIVISE